MKKLLLLSTLALTLAACGNDGATGETTEQNIEETTETLATPVEQETTSAEQTSSESQATETFGLDEVVQLYSNETGELFAEVAVTQVTDNASAFPDYLQATDHYDVDNLILIQVEYTNVAYPENFAVGLHDFQVYGTDGKMLPNISQQNGGDPVAQGRTGTSEFYVESENTHDTIELDLIDGSYAIATFEAAVEH